MRLAALAFWITFAAAVIGLGLPPVQYFVGIKPVAHSDYVLIYGSAWVTVLFWLVGVSLLWLRRYGEYSDDIARAWWVAGWGFALVHTVVVFQLFEWSHAAAVAHTERGSGFGAGVYVNYLFLAVWTADVVWLCTAPRSYQRRPRWVAAAVHGFLAFVVFNAAVVYGTGFPRWFAAAGFGWLAGLLAVGFPRRPGAGYTIAPPQPDPAPAVQP
jgi:hypothetical protein